MENLLESIQNHIVSVLEKWTTLFHLHFWFPFPGRDFMLLCTAHFAGNSCSLLLTHEMISCFVKFLSSNLFLLPNHRVLILSILSLDLCSFYLPILVSIKNRPKDFPDIFKNTKIKTKNKSHHSHEVEYHNFPTKT